MPLILRAVSRALPLFLYVDHNHLNSASREIISATLIDDNKLVPTSFHNFINNINLLTIEVVYMGRYTDVVLVCVCHTNYNAIIYITWIRFAF